LSSKLINGEDADAVPPETTVNLSGPTGLNGWYTGMVTATITATDDFSGILKTLYSLDGGLTYSSYASPIEIVANGIVTLKFYSVDRAGNNEEVKTTEIKIDTRPPEIAARFDVGTNNFQFFASDNLDFHPHIACDRTSCLATDRAGHETIVVFKKGEGNTGKNLSLKTASYNGVNIVLLDNLLTVYLSKTGDKIGTFYQSMRIKQKEVLKIFYDPHKNESLITELKEDGSFLTYTQHGIKFLQVGTNRGMIKTGVK
jgi:hypothetical protein